MKSIWGRTAKTFLPITIILMTAAILLACGPATQVRTWRTTRFPTRTREKHTRAHQHPRAHTAADRCHYQKSRWWLLPKSSHR